ncbi:16S rRNA (cytosine(1402)-N(4))-methyltransferase RsmH [bacterium]|nr:16S rRNA (cytosine(1402)-N(4))-methyltransferase RsmH [bacterium]
MEHETFVAHKSVLVNEVLEYLDPKKGGIYLDVTFGAGGHTREILQANPDCKVIALDWDKKSIEEHGVPLQEEFPGRLTILWGNFSNLYRILKKAKIKKLDGILADFGTSQMQITEGPGFSVHRDTSLDMRMSPSHQKVTAAQILNEASREELREIFWKYGQEKFTKQIVDGIILERKKKKFKTTMQLTRLIERIVPRNKKQKIHPATRVFQALRICVNKELENIVSFLSAAMNALKKDGRLVCISFHSLEDRLVKQFFVDKSLAGIVEILTPKVIVASKEEIDRNRSSRSAKLRAVKFLGK